MSQTVFAKLVCRLLGLLAVLAVAMSFAEESLAEDKPLAKTKTTDAEALFNQRILPIFRSTTPSSCVQCHLSSVDLKNYILPSQEKTFASLRDQGLIDLTAPEQSKILKLIQMGAKDLDKGARLIHEKTRQAEYEAFAHWIKACCNDPAIRDLPPLSAEERARPAVSDEVIRHTRKSRVVDSFVRNVWSQRMRCFPCHTPHEIDPEDPRHMAALKTRRELKEKYPPATIERLDIFKETPEATLQYLVDASRKADAGELPLINLQDARNSLLLLKPLAKLPAKDAEGHFAAPSSSPPVTHGGGLKMHPDDQSYKSFTAWLEDYAKVVGKQYTSVDQLPPDNWHATSQILRLTKAPESWPVGTPVQMFVHVWEKDGYSTEPIAFTQGTVTPRRMVNGALFVIADPQSDAAGELASALGGGRYLIKVYPDTRGLLAKNPTLLLGREAFFGQIDLNRSRWREGFRNAASISGTNLEIP